MEIKLGDKIELTALQLTLAFSNLVEYIIQRAEDNDGNVDVMQECRNEVVRLFKGQKLRTECEATMKGINMLDSPPCIMGCFTKRSESYAS